MIDRFKELEKGQIIIFSICGLIILFTVYYTIHLVSVGEENSLSLFDVPQSDKESELYESRLAAYNNEKRSSLSSLFGDDELKNTNSEELTNDSELKRKVDSMLNISNTKVVKRVVSNRNSTPSTSYKSPSKTKAQLREERIKKFQEESNSEFEKYYTNNAIQKIKLKTDSKIFAVIHGDQKIKSGSRIELRLSQPTTINGINYPKSTLFYGFSTFSSNRVIIDINNISGNDVRLKTYDFQDGGLGIYTENSVGSEIYKEGIDDISDEINVGNIPIAGSVKNILKRRQKEDKIFLINNYRVILKSQS